MKTLPYKFLVVLPKVERMYRWNRFYDRKEKGRAAYGALVQLGARTRRIDLPGRFFYSRRALRETLARAFPKARIGYVRATSTIVAIWTDDDFWLSDRRAWKTMEVWNEREEPKRLWKALAGVEGEGLDRHRSQR